MKATLRKDRLTGRAWLEFSVKPEQSVIETLKREGWRWSRFRGQWHNPQRFVVPPPGVNHENGGECDYAAERSDRLDGRAARAEAEAANARAAVSERESCIPLGQPILPGHHSERRHRRDLERIRAGVEKTIRLSRKAERLQQRAKDSQRHQEYTQSAPVIVRRIERLKADLRRMERDLWGSEGKAEHERRFCLLRTEITTNEQALKAAGGLPAYQVAPDDIARISDCLVRVERVNRKTLTGVIVEGGAAGMRGRWDKTFVQAVIRRSGPTSVNRGS